MSTARESILANVRQALKNPSHVPQGPAGVSDRIQAGLQAATPPDRRGLAEQFKKEVEVVSGECFILSTAESASDKLGELLQAAGCSILALDGQPSSHAAVAAFSKARPGLDLIDGLQLDEGERKARMALAQAGVLTADAAIADSGTIVIYHDAGTSSLASVLPEAIFVLLPASRLQANLHEFIRTADADKSRNMVMITGPSRTADIEKILILGAHGPKRLVVLISMD